MTALNKLPIQAIIDSIVGRILCFLLYPTKFFRNKLKKEIKSISIIKFSGIGDAVLTLPLIKKIKEQKKARVRVICGKELLSIYEGINFIDEVFIIDISNKNIFVNLPKYIHLMFNKTDYGIDTSHSTRFTMALNYLSSKRCSGFYNKNLGFFRNAIIDYKIRCDPNKHIIFNFLDLAKEIDIKYNEGEISLTRLKYSSKDINKINNLLGKQEYIGICPFHELEYKKWPIQYFKEVVSFLLEKYRYKILIIGDKRQKRRSRRIYWIISKKRAGKAD